MIALFIFLSALRNIFAREQVEMLNIFGHADGNLLDTGDIQAWVSGHWRWIQLICTYFLPRFIAHV